MNQFARPMPAIAAALVLFAAAPAGADDGRRHVMTPVQKIDLVRDLPNDATFERDGEYFDLGYLYPIHTVNGASVASAGGEAGFVLYHDDRYARLDASDLRMVSMALGEDPTEGYNPPVAASSATSIDAAQDVWSRPSRSGGSSAPPSAATSAGFGFGAAFAWIFFLIVGAIMVVVRVLKTLARGATQLHQNGSASYTAAIGGDPFETRVAARLAELQSGDGSPDPAAYQPPVAAAVRGFGRKGA